MTTRPGAAAITASTSASSKQLPVGLFGYAMKTSAGRCRPIASSMAGRSSANDGPSGTPMNGIRRNCAVIRYMTNDGTGARTAASGAASIVASIVISSSEPLPSTSPAVSGTPNRSRIAAFSSAYAGTG